MKLKSSGLKIKRLKLALVHLEKLAVAHLEPVPAAERMRQMRARRKPSG